LIQPRDNLPKPLRLLGVLARVVIEKARVVIEKCHGKPMRGREPSMRWTISESWKPKMWSPLFDVFGRSLIVYRMPRTRFYCS
jgi:hypothetical protein